LDQGVDGVTQPAMIDVAFLRPNHLLAALPQEERTRRERRLGCGNEQIPTHLGAKLGRDTAAYPGGPPSWFVFTVSTFNEELSS
jgi:hypothetical protein